MLIKHPPQNRSNLNNELLNLDCFFLYKYKIVIFFKINNKKSENHMSNDIDLAVELNLLECPFLTSCNLPKIEFLCKIPECKNCPDYESKVERIHHSHNRNS